MELELIDDDRRAVDMVLDRDGYTLHLGSQTDPRRIDRGMRPRVTRVKQFLAVLSQWPVPEIPADLCRRTLRYIDRALRAEAGQMTIEQADLIVQRPAY